MKTFNIRYRSVEKLKDFLAIHSIKGGEKTLVQIFTSLASPEQIMYLTKNIHALLPNTVIIGCSTDGEIIDGKILYKNTVISITEFEHSTAKLLFLEGSEDVENQGALIKETLVSTETKAIILLATFKSLNAQKLLEQVHYKNPSVVVSGALAADNGKFKSSIVFDSENITSNGIVAVALDGVSLRASNHFTHHWEPISRKFKVDDAHENRIHMLDNKQIKQLYSQYIGADTLPHLLLDALQFPFVLKRDGQFISQLAIDENEDGSILFASNVRKREILQIAFANIDKVCNALETFPKEVCKNPTQTLYIYASSARRRFIEHFAHKEIEGLKDIAQMSGFFGFGEFFANEERCHFLAQSLSVLSLSESEELPALHPKKPQVVSKSGLHFETIKVLSNIAQVSSRELEDLNKILEQRVREGVRENRKKDSIMIHNSKLAQLGEMMGLIAHQWRQPLSAISATATGMQIKFELGTWTPEYVESSLHNIDEYVSHLSDTINDFTNFFKPTKRKRTIKSREIIKKSLFIMSPLLSKDSILVIKKYNSDNLIETYPNEVVQVLLNLIKNSVNALLKRHIKNPEIYINEYQVENKNIIEISDNAGGIDESLHEKIFEPYFSTKNAENSMGLGLYMSKFIIEESCEGRLDVENINEGVKFTITLYN